MNISGTAKKCLSQACSPSGGMIQLSITVREYRGGNNGKSHSLAVYMMYQVARGRAARNFMVPITQKTAHEVTETMKAKYSFNVDDQLGAYIKSGLSKVANAMSVVYQQP